MVILVLIPPKHRNIPEPGDAKAPQSTSAPPISQKWTSRPQDSSAGMLSNRSRARTQVGIQSQPPAPAPSPVIYGVSPACLVLWPDSNKDPELKPVILNSCVQAEQNLSEAGSERSPSGKCEQRKWWRIKKKKKSKNLFLKYPRQFLPRVEYPLALVSTFLLSVFFIAAGQASSLQIPPTGGEWC